MYTIRIENYRNEYTRSYAQLYFGDLQQFRDWLFNQMIQPVQKYMLFPNLHQEITPITIQPEEGGVTIKIHQIMYTDANGDKRTVCVFSDGHFTNGKKFMGRKTREFIEGCVEYQQNGGVVFDDE